MGNRQPSEPERQAMIQFLTTEHFTLQGARATAIADTNSRLQVYMGVLSTTILSLALVAQISRLGDAFFAFSFVLLPMAYIFGLTTMGRLKQSWMEWFVASQGMGRIRRFFVETAPEAERYLTLPATDDPWAILGGAGIRGGGRLRGLVTASAVVAMVNSVIGGVLAALIVVHSNGSALLLAVSGGGTFVLSMVILGIVAQGDFLRKMASAEVRFPPD